MMKNIRYTFTEIDACNMCGHPTSSAKVLGQRLNKSQGSNPKSKTGISVSVVQCTNCGLIYSNPQPIPADIQDHYGIPPENYWTEDYFKIDPMFFVSYIDKATELIDFKPGMKALDIGTGVGKCMVALSAAGFDTYGLEPSEPFRARAISQLNIPEDRLRLGMVETLDYPEGEFDFINFGAVLEHLYSPAFCIERALKWLRPNGVIHIDVPSSAWLIPKIYNSYFKLIGTNYTTNLSPMHEPFHMYEFGLRSFEALSKKLGLEIAHHQYSVCGIYHIPKALHPLLKWHMRRTDTGMDLTIWLRKK